MKINNSPTFGSKILYSAKLKKNTILGLQKSISVFVSELEKNDINTIKNANPLLLTTKYGGPVLCRFFDECANPLSELGTKRKFIVIETVKKSSPDSYKGIAQLENKDQCIWVKRLQSLSYIPAFKNIKGVGSCIMYAVFKLAQQLNKTSVMLNSDFAATKFYRKIGMHPVSPYPCEATFTLHKSRFEKVTKALEDKFDIKEYKAK